MARHTHLRPHLSSDTLERRSRTTKEPNERSGSQSGQVLWQLGQDHTAVAVSAVTGHAAYWIEQIAQRYTTAGSADMHHRRHTASHRTPSIVPPALQEELRHAVAEAAACNDSWTGDDAAACISERFGGQHQHIGAGQEAGVSPLLIC